MNPILTSDDVYFARFKHKKDGSRRLLRKIHVVSPDNPRQSLCGYLSISPNESFSPEGNVSHIPSTKILMYHDREFCKICQRLLGEVIHT